MAQLNWEKNPDTGLHREKPKRGQKTERLKFLIGGLLILGAIAYLMFSSTLTGARFFIGVDDLLSSDEYIGQQVRITGAVIGETIEYNSVDGEIWFTVANVPDEFEDLATALFEAVNDPDAQRLPVYIENEVKPDLLRDEAQAIMTGHLGEDGVFYATELNLKCPSRFEEAGPQVASEHTMQG